MNTNLKQRAYRKAINSPGRMYLGDETRAITIKNISTSGVLIGLSGDGLNAHSKHTLEDISLHKPIHFCIPPLQLSGSAKIARMFTGLNLQLFLGMEFQDLVFCGANTACSNDSPYTSSLAIPGRLILDGEYFDFLTVSMSTDELIVRLPLMIGIEKGMELEFEFTQAKLKGWVKVVWTLEVDNFETLMRLHYTRREKGGDDISRHADWLLPQLNDCPMAHRLRVFAAIKDKASEDEKKISLSRINLAPARKTPTDK